MTMNRISLPNLLQGIRYHVVFHVETGTSKLLDQGSRCGDPTEPLREDDQADCPHERDAVCVGASASGQVVDHHLASGVLQSDREDGLLPRIESPSTDGCGDRGRGHRDLPAGVVDGLNNRVGGGEARDLLEHWQWNDEIHSFCNQEVNPPDFGQEDERRRVDDAPGRHAPPPPATPRKSPGRPGPRHARAPG
jgi:hypothetical protein